MMMPPFLSRALLAGLALGLAPLAASAQLGGAPATRGPMIVERVHNGFLAAPDVKVTEVDRRTSELVGGYAGWIAADQLFIGGGGYWMANRSSSREMAYGGLVVQWMARPSERVGFSAKGLLGGGRATLSSTAVRVLAQPDFRDGPFMHLDRDQLRRGPPTAQFRYREGFFVAEPELDLRVTLSRRVHIAAGLGYRFVGTEFRDNKRLRGAVGSVGLQIGAGG
ncbi:MAG: hypothetical protein A3F69_04905 [Acidobacteria bacterium RIFCSPLOWO2_12_FULL_66_10]|nr:MAG: hypothetical protein A3F69_04905 [Acidobacteria bacterium RIFCSPLOWO2_12_FULL_66_10]